MSTTYMAEGVVGESASARVRPLRSPAELQAFMHAEYPLSDQQFAAVTAPLAPAVVLAGAGSGKTTLMAARVVWLVGTGQVRPDEVLGLTFTTKAAAELAGRIREALRAAGVLGRSGAATGDGAGDGEQVLEPTVATYNAYAASLLSEHGLRIGHEPDTRVIADASRYQLASRVISRHTREVRHLSDHPQTVVNYLLGLDAQMSEHLVGVEEILRFQEHLRPQLEEQRAAESRVSYRRALDAMVHTFDRREELIHLVEEYRTLKQQLGLMEFSDQIELGARLALRCPEVGEAVRAQHKVVLLDEYQDTSVAQALMLSRLFSGDDPDSGRGHPVMAVGDPNQAIYGWRGASVSNILGFGRDFPRDDGCTDVRSYPLTVNRRSDRLILELANRLAAPLVEAGDTVPALEAAEAAGAGEVHAEVFETSADELSWLPGQVHEARLRQGSWNSIGVLARDNAHAAEVFAALSEADVPVEIVGLQGLLGLPEVVEVVSTLTLLHDLTANADLLALLSGPRWAIGPRDLALLGRRAAELADVRGSRPHDRRLPSVEEELAEAVDSSDPTEAVSLVEALESPGEAAYSPEARERFALLAEELRRLRAHAGEPLLDLVRRIIDTTGIDVELASAVSPAARARRDNLDLFVKAVAEFQAVDGEVSLAALVSYLEAEDEAGTGLDIATPTAADTVKLLTVHRAKGLEWDVVFVVGVSEGRFPAGRTRPKWTATPGVLPYPLRGDRRDLPDLADMAPVAFASFAEACRTHEQQEELRLAYVAFTRPRHELWISSYLWGSRKTPYAPSPYQLTARELLEEQGEVLPVWPEIPESGARNPMSEERLVPWPPAEHTAEVEHRRRAAALVQQELARGLPDPELELLDEDERGVVAAWDVELDRLVAEARRQERDHLEVPLPSHLSATALGALRADPDSFAAALARPMPRRPSPSARHGTRFHAWVERYYARDRQELLLDVDELGGRADQDVRDEVDLAELIAAFEAGPFAGRTDVEIETPFLLVLGGQVIRGRIDAVFHESDGTDLVVDWKTSRAHTADPTQLAVYRLAWAELRGIPVERVRAGFVYVREGAWVEHTEDLPGREELERIFR